MCEIGSRDQLDSAKQKVSPIRKSQIELSSQLARHSRSRIVVRIKGKDLDKPSQVSCGTYSRLVITASHFRSLSSRVISCSFFSPQCGVIQTFYLFPHTIFVSLSLFSFLPSLLPSSLLSFLFIVFATTTFVIDRSNPWKDILLSASTFYRRITVIRAAWN